MRPLDCGDGSNPSGREVEKPDGRTAGRIWPRSEIDSFLNDGKGQPVDRFEHSGLFPAVSGHFPKAAGLITFRVIDPLAVRRFGGQKAPLPGHLDCFASTRRHFPDLVLTAAIRDKINPLPIPRPTGLDIGGWTGGEAFWLASVGADDEERERLLRF